RLEQIQWYDCTRVHLRTLGSECERIRLGLGDGCPVAFQGDTRRFRTTTRSGIQRVNRVNLPIGQREIKNLKILCDTSWLHGFWNRRATLLNVPTQHNLSRTFAVLFSNVIEYLVIQCPLLSVSVDSYTTDGRPRLGDNAVLGVQCLQLTLLEIRMIFNFAYRRNHVNLHQEI